jgi:3-hydroxyacyl-CoA dehydrogenase/3-hydroxy-2-methylbutyryl-CoA dehydrogenase
MTLPLARDLGKHNIRIMTICPGAFETPMTQTDFRPQDREKIFTSTPLSRFGKP